MKKSAKNTQFVRKVPDYKFGLTSAEVEMRQSLGLTNRGFSETGKSYASIVANNLFSLFNFINIAFAVILFFIGSYKNMLFMGVVLSNLFIGIIQEVRAKKATQKLSLLADSKVIVRRDGKELYIDADEILQDDILIIRSGTHIAADCTVLCGDGYVNEAFITGESEPIPKSRGDKLLSGSFAVSGSITAVADNVGSDAYISKLQSGIRKYKLASSEIIHSLKIIIRAISIAIIPIGVLLYLNQSGISGYTSSEALVKTIAALLGMIPEGLVLLTSSVLAVSVVRLSKKGVLTSELNCIETLARVNVLCLDKTGTLTSGKMTLDKLIPLENADADNLSKILCSIVHSFDDANPTFSAISDAYRDFPCTKLTPKAAIEFSSSLKYCAVQFADDATYILGAGDIILRGEAAEKNSGLCEKIAELSADKRVLLLAKSDLPLNGRMLPDCITPIALLLLSDELRSGVNKTLSYFKQQGVAIKIISGDSLATVTNIAVSAGVDGCENGVDCSLLTTDEELSKAALTCTIFARVSPDQKAAIIKALKASGKTVAMTGDGVNDVLAMRESDCSIGMAAGADAVKSISQFVLVESDFAALPSVVAEGRRTINNVERSASLFLQKTVFSVLLSVAFMLLPLPYPFIPIQLSLISTLTIGIPSFILALEPNHNVISGSFFKNVLGNALPGGITIAVNLVVMLLISRFFNLPHEAVSTMCVYITALIGFLMLFKISFGGVPLREFTQHKMRLSLCISLPTLFVLCIVLLPTLFSLSPLKGEAVPILACFALSALVLFVLFNLLAKKIFKR